MVLFVGPFSLKTLFRPCYPIFSYFFGYLLVTMARATWHYRRPNTVFPLDRYVFPDSNSQERKKEKKKGGGGGGNKPKNNSRYLYYM